MPAVKYAAIYQSLRHAIENQEYAYQSTLPSEHQLIQMYDCSRNTVRRAIAELAERICTGTMLIGNYGSDEARQEQGLEGMLRPYEAAAVNVFPFPGSSCL